MYGYWHSVKTNYSFDKDELKQLFITSLAFAFVLTSYYQNLFVISGDIRIVLSDTAVFFFIISLIATFLSMYFHVALQKLVGIKLGYQVTYAYWLNGILIGLFLAVLTFGKIPILSLFILPGAVTLKHVTKLRLGKFQYSMNAKDIARVSLAGPLAHIIIVTFLGVIYFMTDKNTLILTLIKANLMLLVYSMLPIPKIDIPTKIDSASDGLGLFFYSRTVYLLCILTTLFYTILILTANIFSFVLAFMLGLVTVILFSVTMR
ncbi:MAG: hypothetical protein ACP5N1_07090 [Candidatus Woesearchaeota archaeon]